MSVEDVGNVGDWFAALAVERPHLVENPGRLVRMSWGQAMEAQRKWHDELAARSARLIAEKKGFGGAPDDVESVLDLEEGFRWVRVLSPEGLDYEGNAMGHCVGKGHYDEGCTILSLRDADNLPHCTVEWCEEECVIEQVQGKANQPVVERYHGMVRNLVDRLRPMEVRGATQFGHLFAAVNDQPARLMAWHELRAGDRIEGNLDLSGFTVFTHFPDNLQVAGNLYLRNCTSLTHLPQSLEVSGNLNLRGCTALTQLPDGLVVKGNLVLGDCTSLTHLPDELVVDGFIYLPNCDEVRSVDEARAWFAERFPTENPAPGMT